MPRVVYSFHRPACWVLTFALLCASLPAQAQESPPEIPLETHKAIQIAEAEKILIDAVVQYWSDKLFSGQARNIAQAKDTLAGIPREISDLPFRLAYAKALEPLVDKASIDKDPTVRIAAMAIACTSIQPGTMASACTRGLSDTHPAVRYLAGRAVADIFSKNLSDPGPFPKQVQLDFLAAIKNATASEKLDEVNRQLARAAAFIWTRESFDLSIQLLDTHLTRMRDDPSLSPDTAKDMFEAMSIRLNSRKVELSDNVTEQFRQLATRSGRCLAILKLRIETTGVVDPLERQSWAELMLVVEDPVWKLASEQLDPSVKDALSKPSATMKNGKWEPADLSPVIERWIGTPDSDGILTSSGIKAPRVQMILPPAPQPTPPADNAP